MDIATVIGMVLGFLLVFGPILMHGTLMSFIDIPSMMIVIGGAFSTMFTMYPLKDVLGMGKVFRNAFFPPADDPIGIIDQMVDLGEKARREGILALERELKSIDNEYLAKAIQLAVDGNEVEIIEGVLETEISFIEERHKVGKSISDNLAAMAPGYGMIGTLIGLVEMLQSMDDPASIGPSMAVALITTFYGSLLANWIFTPMSNKLEYNSATECLVKQMILAGILSIQSGDNPRVLRVKLETYLAPSLRKGNE